MTWLIFKYYYKYLENFYIGMNKYFFTYVKKKAVIIIFLKQ